MSSSVVSATHRLTQKVVEITGISFWACNYLVVEALLNEVKGVDTSELETRHYNDDGDHLWEAQVDSLLSEFAYTVRADGKRTAVDESVYDGISTKTTRVDWVYDNIGRLVQEDYDADGTDLDFTADYLFDLVGNRLKKSVDRGRDAVVDEIFSYAYDLNDRLLTEAFDDKTAANADRFTRYEYGPDADFTTDPDNPFGGDHTTQTKKSVWNNGTGSGNPVEVTDYGYNLQGRMNSAAVDLDADGIVDRREEYEYDDTGIRVAKTELVDSNDDGTVDTTTRTDYHVDKQNHTGYAQVLEEMQGDVVQNSWTIGHDVFLEAVAANQLRHLLKDGHGSTRQLVDALGKVIQNGQAPQVFAYDAYGVPIGFTLANALTTLLYSGEMTDQLTGLQYLRARYYNPTTGTFNRLDPFAGNFRDPQSLHKYLYTHGDPVNGIDPTGMFEGLTGLVVNMALNSMLTAIAVPILKPAIDWVASGLTHALLPPDFESKFLAMPPSAFMIGAEGSLTLSYPAIPIAFGGEAGGELLVSPSTGNVAAYFYGGYKVALAGSSTINMAGTAKVGAVYGMAQANDYEGPFRSLTIPIMSLSRNVKDKMAQTLTTMLQGNAIALAATGFVPPQLTNIPWNTVSSSIQGVINKINNLSVTLFFDPIDLFPFGFSSDYTFYSKGDNRLSLSFLEYYQLWPNDPGIPFS